MSDKNTNENVNECDNLLENLNRSNNVENHDDQLNISHPTRADSATDHVIDIQPIMYASQEILNNASRCAVLIDEHLQEIQNRINTHTLAAFRFLKYDRLMGFPITILSSFVASSLMVVLFDKDDPEYVKIMGLVLSVCSFLLSVGRDYFNYSKRHNEHNISAKLYTNLLRQIEVRLINNHLNVDDRRDIFRDIVDQMSIIEQYELPVPTDIDKKIRTIPMIPRSVQLQI